MEYKNSQEKWLTETMELPIRTILNDPDVKKEIEGNDYEVGKPMPGIKIPHKIKVRGGKVYGFFKRVFDIFNSLLAIIVLSPLMLLTAIIIKLTSKGPVIYVSRRVGKNGRIFKFYKFRSMYYDADARLADLRKLNEIEGGVTFKIKNDPRITPFGKFIRKTSIDELPQLFNILKGDMSIIGPRAAIPYEVARYDERALDRLLVPQGLSGEWQANGRSTTTFEEMIDMDIKYIEKKRGFFYDIWLIIKTIVVVISGKGAQ